MTQPRHHRRQALGLVVWIALVGCQDDRTRLVASGRFAGPGPASEATADIYRTAGALMLRARHVPRGPDLELRLVERDADPASAFLVVGRLGPGAPLVVELPPCTDVARYQTVAVWSRTRQTALATAPLVHHTPGGGLP